MLDFCLKHEEGIDTVLYYSSIEAVGSQQKRSGPPGAKEYERPYRGELKGCPYKMTKTMAHYLAEEYAPAFRANNKKIIIHLRPPVWLGMENVPTGV